MPSSRWLSRDQGYLCLVHPWRYCRVNGVYIHTCVSLVYNIGYSTRSTLYNLSYTLYSVHCTLYSVQCTVYSIPSYPEQTIQLSMTIVSDILPRLVVIWQPLYRVGILRIKRSVSSHGVKWTKGRESVEIHSHTHGQRHGRTHGNTHTMRTYHPCTQWLIAVLCYMGSVYPSTRVNKTE